MKLGDQITLEQFLKLAPLGLEVTRRGETIGYNLNTYNHLPDYRKAEAKEHFARNFPHLKFKPGFMYYGRVGSAPILGAWNMVHGGTVTRLPTILLKRTPL